MTIAYVLCEIHSQGSAGRLYRPRQVLPVDLVETPMEELRHGLRGWAVSGLTTGHARDGWYVAFLIELDDDGQFDAYHAFHSEDIVWCHETEYLPVPQA